ncbi:MAG: endonuclease/exonuclease/phosphatase family protein [Ktedonobacteraceae bacterium]|nr:endonuclease/exonuclease/phosphatase family protein [Ktedonobacteraceae bacterium]
MTNIVTYNILAGGYSSGQPNGRRVEQLARIIRSTQPDVVGVVEAVNPRKLWKPLAVEELAAVLGMQLVLDKEVLHLRDYQPALLTRLPIVYTKIHPRPGILTRPLLEVCLEETNGKRFIVFTTHLSAAFSQGWAGNAIRKREIGEIVRIMGPQREAAMPHVLLGDFNALAPGDTFKACNLLRYIASLDHATKRQPLGDGYPHLNSVVPQSLRFLNPLLRLIPRNILLSTAFDRAAALYAPRSCIALLQKACYADCYRRVHPHTWGFTCPASAPAGRIDFIFASPEMAGRLETCYVVTEGEGLAGADASDHLAVAARFGDEPVNLSTRGFVVEPDRPTTKPLS